MYGERVNVENLTASAHHYIAVFSNLYTLNGRILFAAATNFNRFVVNVSHVSTSLVSLLVQITPLADLPRVIFDLFFDSFHYHITQFHCCNVRITVQEEKRKCDKNTINSCRQ